ncbi:MAG: BrnT family toxin [Deltaproteobacteria bacterium]|nr:BrnT family toxin [Deltaproteobacteria bacterium]
MYILDCYKNESNKKKHGITFEEARDHIFEGENLLVAGVAYDKDEYRHAIIGKHQGNYYVGIFTIAEQSIRIISVRRASKNEEKQAQELGL